MPFRDDDRQGLDPREFPEPEEADDERLPCPACRALIYADSERCPACGHYVSNEEVSLRRPWWIVVGVLVCLAVAIYWVWPGQ